MLNLTINSVTYTAHSEAALLALIRYLSLEQHAA